ncbi:P50 [Xanthomonas phage phiL7]|uniref:p50 n=1 Tax=Xanthomonas phage phiL7 TaxID=538979 RepID=C4ML50_9CAUD|nr:P50 [Xanthomonas phage phiL7]ACE75790.1 P50 [Xanthomonas phage phiL7]
MITLNEEEARALGSLRYSGMLHGSSLWKALSGLPESAEDFSIIRPGACIGEPKFRAITVDTEVAKTQPKRYKVQFKARGSDSWGGFRWHVEFMPQATRNEAYRVMRRRGAQFRGWDPSTNSNVHGSYRVVSEDVKDGPEEDRGYYRVQWWSVTSKLWKDCFLLPGWGRIAFNYFSTPAAAHAAISAFGPSAVTYRVKWYPSGK